MATATVPATGPATEPATATVPATGPAEPAAADMYALGSNPTESARLQRQSDELRPQTAELLGRIGLATGSERDRPGLRP